MSEPTETLPDETEAVHPDESTGWREDSWSRFLAQHNRLLLRVAHLVAPNREDAMDAYAMVLEELRDDDGRRLRAYQADGRSKFTTWLVVVARRICVDFLRRKYGRYAPASDGSELRRRARQSLAEGLGAGIDLEAIADDRAPAPDARVSAREVRNALDSAMRELSNDDRLLLKLRFDDNLSASAIAKLTGSRTPFHVYRRLNALLAHLRARLASLGVDGAQ